MTKLIRPGQIIFALGIIALGLLQFFAKDFIMARPPAASWAVSIPGKLIWAYTSGVLFITASVAIIFNIKARLAAVFIGILIFIFSFLLRHLYEMVNWVGAYKALALTGGAFIVSGSFGKNETNRPFSFFTNNNLVLIGILFLSLFMIICGLAHFKFDDFVISLVPSYMINLYLWTYIAGTALLLGGIGLIFNSTRKWAALLSGIMILIWFFMVHIPRAINIPPLTSVPIYSEWMGVGESFTFSGIFFVLAGMLSTRIAVATGMV
jgi:uncharacterized membrane protein